MNIRTLMLALAGGCALTVLAGAALADPPGLVGRISDIEGDVSFLPPGESDWTDAIRNYPVAPGESFWTDDDGRTELQIGPMEARLDSDTELDVLALDYGQTRFGLPQGSVDLRVWQVPSGGITIATPAGDVVIDQPGVYRIDVGASDDSGDYPPVDVTVFDGEAQAPGSQGFIPIEAGSSALIYAGQDPYLEDAQDASIDDWARTREANEHWDEQANFSPSLTGYEDLEGQGDFVDTPDYGTVWFPNNVPPDWAPYRYGHWASVQPWGWTWIDDQPWGFAPFHYGRWAQINGRWGWAPGRADPQPVYAPALVAFVGGGGWSISFGAGGSDAAIGWIPLGPDEVYRPTYPVSQTYLRQVNVANVRETTINTISVNVNVGAAQYRNASAATVVHAAAFAGGAPVQRATAPTPLAALAHAPVITTVSAAPAPTPQARKGGGVVRQAAGGGAHVAAPPPAKLQAVRTAVAAQPPRSNKPPTIVGAKITPHAKPAPGAAALIAPAQIKNPGAQEHVPVRPPVGAQSGVNRAPPPAPFPEARVPPKPPAHADLPPPPPPPPAPTPTPEARLPTKPPAHANLASPPPPSSGAPDHGVQSQDQERMRQDQAQHAAAAQAQHARDAAQTKSNSGDKKPVPPPKDADHPSAQ